MKTKLINKKQIFPLLAMLCISAFIGYNVHAQYLMPNTYPSTQTAEAESQCPGINTCYYDIIPGDDYCGGCAYSSCNCNCATGTKTQEHWTADCHVWTIGVPPFTTSIAKCMAYHKSSTSQVSKNICWMSFS